MARNPYFIASYQPWAIAILVAAIASGLLITWWLLPLGLVLYLVCIVLLSRDQTIRIQANQPLRPNLRSKALRDKLNKIEQAHKNIKSQIDQVSGPMQRLLTPIAEQTQDLVHQAYNLCQTGEILEQYLAQTQTSNNNNELADLQQRYNATNDAYTRDQLKEAMEAVRERAQNAADLKTYSDRTKAQLQNISASLENVLAETIRLRTADAAHANAATSQVTQRLSELKIDMDTFQQVLDTALHPKP